MERFCEKCGSLVKGSVKFCPTCGAPMKGAVDLGKNGDVMPQQMQSVQQPVYTANVNMTTGYSTPQYGQSINPSAATTQQMTTGQWMGTIILCSIFGIVSFILTAVWAFGSTTPEPKRSFCRGYFFVQLILMAISTIIGIAAFIFIMSNVDSLTEFLEKVEEFANGLSREFT